MQQVVHTYMVGGPTYWPGLKDLFVNTKLNMQQCPLGSTGKKLHHTAVKHLLDK